MRCYISSYKNNHKISPKIKQIINLENKIGLFSNKNLLNFKYKINNHRKKLKNFLKKIKKKNNISAYGASGKGQALLQYINVDNKIIDVIFDKSKLKQNKFTLGSKIPIKDPKFIAKKNVDYLLLLSWNLKKEIIKQEKNFLEKGGRLIIPFPKPKVVSKNI